MRFSFLIFVLISSVSEAARDSATVPLNETHSAPAIDLIREGQPIDRDLLLDLIRENRIDSSTLEPQLSRIYRGEPLSPVGIPDLHYPDSATTSGGDSVVFRSFLSGTSGLVRARVTLESDPHTAFQMNLSLDAHAALARNALLRKLGYPIPSPKHYSKLRVRFDSTAERDRFLDRVSTDTLTSRSRWIAESEPPSSTGTSLVLQDLVLEPERIEVPQLHWGILTPGDLNSRRPLRAILVPLTLLDVPESVNLFSFEPVKVFNEQLVFSRSGAEVFQNETSIGDARWIARKIAKLTRSDWQEIIGAGQYPADIGALILEKTLARVNGLMNLLSIADFKPHRYDPGISVGSVIRGKATRERYDGYALRFTHGDPLNPLRASELARFFGVSALNGILGLALEQANQFLQIRTAEDQINAYRETAYQKAFQHFQNHPNEPYVQPFQIWGGPVGGANVNASRNIMTGTYYGSESQIQLVDTFSVGLNFGGFIGVSGIPRLGVAAAPGLQAARAYVHVKPLPDLKQAWKTQWARVAVPGFMMHLSQILSGDTDSSAGDSVREFLDSMSPGELLIITDSFTGNAGVSAQVPLGALIGFLPPFGVLEGSVSAGGSYAVLARTTLLRTKDGIQVYLQRIRSGTLELALDSRFFIRLLSAAQNAYQGGAKTEAYVFPEKFESEESARTFQRDLRSILLWNHSENLREDFLPSLLDHKTRGSRFLLGVGPFSWVRRHHFHRIEITPPVDPGNRYRADEHKRTVIEGRLTRILGSDPWGFLGNAARAVEPLLSLGSSFVGDDPSSNFLGKSRTFFVNTQIETTPGKSPAPFMKIERTFSGWSLRKSRLLRLIRHLSAQVSEHHPGQALINPDEFSQTRKIQAYRLSWNLLIYPRGIDRLLDLLHPETSGVDGTLAGCSTSFIQGILRLRSRFSGAGSTLFGMPKSEDQAKEKIRLLNLIASRLSQAGDVGELISVVGKENSFFQASLSGYRTQDENGDEGYFSNTIGLIDQELLTGPLSEIASESRISANEIEARYLSNGY